MTNVNATDYIYAVTLVRIWEKHMLSAQTFAKLYEQGSFDDVMNAAHEVGYLASVSYDEMLSQKIAQTYADLKKIAPDATVFDLFLIKNDYHNIKVLLRANALGQDMDKLLLSNARFAPKVMKAAIVSGHFEDVTLHMKHAYEEAQDILALSHNPQLSDLVVDGYMYADLMEQVHKIDNDFLLKLFQTEIDLVNLKMIFRIENMNKDAAFAKKAILSGGSIAKDTLIEVAALPAESIADFYAKTIYKEVVEDARELTQIEMRCDMYYQSFLTKASEVNFGIEPLIAFLLKKEEEIKKLRMLLVAKRNHIASDALAERLGVAHA